ncbi:MAG: MFS transporter [Proteobacteria bacterium]|nr:MFS transporter [Pseudomonadota bacterium]
MNTLKQMCSRDVLNAAVIVAALGYFVDIYDIVLFGIVRRASLLDIGVPESQLADVGLHLLNMQMIGMLLGGILWGIMGDRKGRLSVLFGSIITYSIANIANAYVTDVTSYAVLRFLAGVGLAGELGAGITLVSEVIPRDKRGLSTAIVASVGVSGAIAAGMIARYADWHTAYIAGGVMGLSLLVLRLKVMESGMFDAVKAAHTVGRGNFLLLFSSWQRFSRYLSCILIGVPIWYVAALPIFLAPELGKLMGADAELSAGNAVMLCYTGLIFGDFISGFGSQMLQSRRKIVAVFMAFTATACLIYLTIPGMSATWYYTMCLMMGFGAGYWAVFVTIAAEQFGTNIRATAATTVPNFVRGSVVPMTAAFGALKATGIAINHAAIIVGVVVFAVSAIALWRLNETIHKDLDYTE